MNRDIIPLTAYFLFALFLMLPLMGPGYYLVLDMQWGPNSFADFQFGDLYGYEPSPYGAYLPFKLVFAALSQVIPVDALQKILLFSILFLSGASAHFSLRGPSFLCAVAPCNKVLPGIP